MFGTRDRMLKALAERGGVSPGTIQNGPPPQVPQQGQPQPAQQRQQQPSARTDGTDAGGATMRPSPA